VVYPGRSFLSSIISASGHPQAGHECALKTLPHIAHRTWFQIRLFIRTL